MAKDSSEHLGPGAFPFLFHAMHVPLITRAVPSGSCLSPDSLDPRAFPIRVLRRVSWNSTRYRLSILTPGFLSHLPNTSTPPLAVWTLWAFFHALISMPLLPPPAFNNSKKKKILLPLQLETHLPPAFQSQKTTFSPSFSHNILMTYQSLHPTVSKLNRVRDSKGELLNYFCHSRAWHIVGDRASLM